MKLLGTVSQLPITYCIVLDFSKVKKQNYATLDKGKGKAVLVFIFLTEHHTMKAYWGVEVQIHAFFYLGSRWG
jgi:hypothetical protein